MLNLFQELVPFSNKRLDKAVSSDGAYSNPVIMSFAFDFTVCSNMLETVLYIRNDVQPDCYSNIVISLMREDKTILTPVVASGSLEHSQPSGAPVFVLNGYTAPVGFSTETIPTFGEGTPIPGAYMSNYVPVMSDLDPETGNVLETDNKLAVKFNYGYDELSNVDWQTRHSVLCIPHIGYKSSLDNPFGTPDTGYHAVRMRLTWKSQSTLLTIRDYFIDVSYEKKEVI